MPSAITRLCFWFLVLGRAVSSCHSITVIILFSGDPDRRPSRHLLHPSQCCECYSSFQVPGLRLADLLLYILIMLTNTFVLKSTDLIDHVDQRILSPSTQSLSPALFSQVTQLIKNNIIVSIMIIITIFSGDPVDPSRWSSVCVHLRHSRSSQPDAPSTAYLKNSNDNDYINVKNSQPLHP